MAKVICLGEVLLRLSAETGTRLTHAQGVDLFYGGGEANVAVSLANYGHQVQFVGRVPENSLGQAAERHLRSYGVATDHLQTSEGRLGTYYVEQGIGQKATAVIYDRQGSVFARTDTLDWELPELFRGTSVFHISGITPALSEQWKALTIELIQAAKTAGCKVSFDCNYRQNLWSQETAGAFLKQVLPLVDYCSAGELDAVHLLEIPDAKESPNYFYQEMQRLFPNISAFYSTNRKIHSANHNELQGTLWINGKCYTSKRHDIDPIVDRIGGGDAFTGGILHGLLEGYPSQKTIEFATAASVLKHFVKGDCNLFSESEVWKYTQTNSAKIER